MHTEIDLNNIPEHIAIIMDGNGRWAKGQSLSRTQGHIEGVKRVEEILGISRELGVKVLTLFTFSTENWNRPETEVHLIMNLITAVLHKKIKMLKKDNIKFQMIGHQDKIPSSVMTAMNTVIEETQDNTGLIMNLAFNYGGRTEIIDAIKNISQQVKDETLEITNITEEVVSASLYTKNLPDPDLLIRTSGEKRISNFLLWQLSYAELYFTDKFWPEFRVQDFKEAIMDYQQRHRRYGNLDAMEAGHE